MDKKKQLTVLLNSLDIFGQPISFYIKGHTKHTSSFGGVFTIILIIGILILTIDSFISLLTKAKMTTQQYTTYQMSPSDLNFTRNDFMFAIGMHDPLITSQNSLFSYSVTLFKRDLNNDLLESSPIELKPCQLEDFQNIVPGFNNSINESFCPVNFSFDIYGVYGNNIYQYLQISINECVNGTSPYITCASQDFINHYFRNLSKVRMKLYFINRYTDFQNITNPFQTFVDEQYWFLSPLGELSYSIDMFFRSSQFISYDDISGISSPNVYNSITYEKERVDYVYIPPNGYTSYSLVNFFSSNYQNYYKRSYENLLGTISFIGGVLNISITCASCLVGIINNYKYKMAMINRLYDFDLQEDNHEKKYQFDAYKPTETLNSLNKKSNEFNNDSKVNQIFHQMNSLRKRLVFTLQDYAKSICCCSKSKTTKKKNDLYNLGTMQISKDMDIITLMKKIQDIEKLKNILLYPNRLKIFNFIPPPIISTNDKIKNLNGITKLIKKNSVTKSEVGQKKSPYKSLNIFQNIDQYYENNDIYKMLKKDQDQVSQNILASLDPEITEIFDCIEEVKNGSNLDIICQKINEIPNSEIEVNMTIDDKKDIIQKDEKRNYGSISENIDNKIDSSNIKDTDNSEISIISMISQMKQSKISR